MKGTREGKLTLPESLLRIREDAEAPIIINAVGVVCSGKKMYIPSQTASIVIIYVVDIRARLDSA